MLTKEHVRPTEILAELNDATISPPLPPDVIKTIEHRIDLTSNQLNEQVLHMEETDKTLVEDDTIVEDWSKEDLQKLTFSSVKPRSFELEGHLSDTDTLEPSRNAALNAIASKYDNKQNKREGDTLDDRFELIKRVGSGGMSTVYMAIDRSRVDPDDHNPYVAIKLLNEELANHPKNLVTLEQEAQKSQSLNHPNIVEIYGFHRDGSNVYLTMEYLVGKTLRDYIRKPDFVGMPFLEALPIINAAGAALAFAHERGIVHCDFKPANVFITDNNEIKVFDFGIARAFQNENEAELLEHSVSALTPAYASVEMLEHLAPDQRDDIYALACTTYELLTGGHPFDRKRATEARDAKLRPKKPQDLTNRQWQALQRALTFDRSKRTPTVPQFLAELNADKWRWQPVTTIAGVIAALLIGWAAALIYLQFLTREPLIIAKQSDQSRIAIEKNIDPSMPAAPTKRSTQSEPLERFTVESPPMEDKRRSTQASRTGPGAKESTNTAMNTTQLTTMMMAAKEGQTAVLKAMLVSGEDVNSRDQHGKTALLWAVEKGHADAVRLLANNGAEVNVRDKAGDTSLTMAAWSGKQNIVEVLLNQGAEIKARNYEGHTALMNAAIKGHEAVLKSLLEAGADPNITTHDGKTPLMAAAWNGHPDIVQILLANASTVNAKSEMGWTPLMYAAWSGDGHIVESLVEYGADPNLKNNYHQTAAIVAAQQGNKEIATFLEQVALKN